jgi:hypothetical protein
VKFSLVNFDQKRVKFSLVIDSPSDFVAKNLQNWREREIAQSPVDEIIIDNVF